ncbi:calcineurin-like phosphoesterase family protein [Glaciihabitans tibetensis]|uniref:Calcineurin-like phosphoesterase family protein n=1 Tax=Glaciihabitans tibetensis TaxID=1266600 RepID=A0A2T0VH17_9MICO|nr:calcineurin-like phosphoesterase family protein [Glaciihabitans tibetensis]
MLAAAAALLTPLASVAPAQALAPTPITSSRVAAAAPAPDDEKIAGFTLAVLPDTQFYSRYATTEEGKQFQTRYGTEPYTAQTTWLAQNKDELGIPFVTHLGDVVDQVSQPNQWIVADAAMKKLEVGGLPYSILAGNHDVLNGCEGTGCTDTDRNLGNEPYLKTFTRARAAAQSTFGGRDSTGFNEYHIVKEGGQEYLVLALSWQTSDAGMAWANSVLDAHPTMPTVLTSHQILNIAGDGVTAIDTPFGQKLWDRVIRGHNQIFMTLNGHHHGNANRVKTNDAGSPVLQVVNDYQMAYQGGNGYLGLYEFDFTNKRIVANQVSPWVVAKPKNLISEFDQAVLTGANEQYTVPFDLTARFSAIAPGFDPGPADHTSYSAKAIEILHKDFVEPTRPVREPAANANDYFHAENTVAHWQFPGADGQVVPVGSTVADLTGANPLKRAPLINGAAEGDVKISSSHHYLSPTPTSMCFTNTNRNTGRHSYLETALTAPLNDQQFAAGYTIETFVKIDPSWTSNDHRWMTALSSGGSRGNAAGADPELTPFFMAVSNLREVQSSAWPINSTAKTNWSGEVMADTWVHVAAVNDPNTQVTTLYVEGAPVLRNISAAVGVRAVVDAAWKLGAGSEWGAPDAGWFGCIGETRVVAQPLAPSQWLTSRTETASAQAGLASFADTFERTNGALGSSWTAARGIWSVSNGTARNPDAAPGNNLAVAKTRELGDSWSVTSTMAVAQYANNRHWIGVAGNVHGEGNSLSYYTLRVAPHDQNDQAARWALLKVTGSTTLSVLQGTLNFGATTYAADRTKPVTLSLSRTGSVLRASIKDSTGATVMKASQTVPDDAAFTGGLTGLYSNTGDISALDFAMTTSREATTPGAATATLAADGRDAVVSWKAPTDDGGLAVTGYTARLMRAGQIVAEQTLPGDARSARFATLPAATYTAIVVASNASGMSTAPAEQSGETKVVAVAPAAPAAPETAGGPGAMPVMWKPVSDDGGSPVTSYIVTLLQNSQIIESREVSAPALVTTFSDLLPGFYTATVAARTAAGTSMPSVVSNESAVEFRAGEFGIVAITMDGANGTLALGVPSSMTAQIGNPTLIDNQSVSTGTLGGITVSDTRFLSRDGWTLNAKVSPFVNGADPTIIIDARQLGIAPRVVSSTAEQVAASPAQTAGESLYPAMLAGAPAGTKPGESVIDAALTFVSPTDKLAGTYKSMMSLTLVSR